MIIIETERLILRHILEDDLDCLLKVYNKLENMRFISNGKINWTKAELVSKYERINESYKYGIGIFSLQLKEEKNIIGEASLFNSFNDFEKLELGYIIDSSFWKRGYGKEICMGLFDYAFNILRVKLLVARMYAENINSVELSKKCGMREKEIGVAENGMQFIVYEIGRGVYF